MSKQTFYAAANPWALWLSNLQAVSQAMGGLKAPLSGDVNQAINPWSLVFGTGQFGFVNINLGTSGDPQVEQEVLDEVGSYGRQLGRIGDALAVLIKHADQGKLAPQEQDALTKLRFQLEAIDKIKERQTRSRKR
jgi:hypothetical protein